LSVLLNIQVNIPICNNHNKHAQLLQNSKQFAIAATNESIPRSS